METFAEKVTKIFHDSGKLQTEFARCAGISEKTFRNYRDGATSPSLEAVAGIARYFNVNCNWLILDEGPIYRDQEKETLPVPSFFVLVSMGETFTTFANNLPMSVKF